MAQPEIDSVQRENDKLMPKLSWLLQRVVVKEGGEVHLPGYDPSSKEIIDSLKEIDRQLLMENS